nr:MAG TPA: hypothetical protein [Caudoviricetes sp.]
MDCRIDGSVHFLLCDKQEPSGNNFVDGSRSSYCDGSSL